MIISVVLQNRKEPREPSRNTAFQKAKNNCQNQLSTGFCCSLRRSNSYLFNYPHVTNIILLGLKFPLLMQQNYFFIKTLASKITKQ